MGILQEFRAFAIKGNVVDLAVGVIIGAAFGKIVDSIVNDLIMPVIGKLLGAGFYQSLYPAKRSGNESGTQRSKEKRGHLCLRQLPHDHVELPDPGVHYFHVGQTDQPFEKRSATRPTHTVSRGKTADGNSRLAEKIIVFPRRRGLPEYLPELYSQ